MENSISQYLTALATQLPLAMVYVLGMVLALVWFSRCPLASILTLASCGLSLFSFFAFTAVYVWLPQYVTNSSEVDVATIQWVYRGISVAHGLVAALATLLLVAAIFSGRSAQSGGK